MISNFERFHEIQKQANSESYSSLSHVEPRNLPRCPVLWARWSGPLFVHIYLCFRPCFLPYGVKSWAHSPFWFHLSLPQSELFAQVSPFSQLFLRQIQRLKWYEFVFTIVRGTLDKYRTIFFKNVDLMPSFWS